MNTLRGIDVDNFVIDDVFDFAKDEYKKKSLKKIIKKDVGSKNKTEETNNNEKMIIVI
jgi:hypothetical protein